MSKQRIKRVISKTLEFGSLVTVSRLISSQINEYDLTNMNMEWMNASTAKADKHVIFSNRNSSDNSKGQLVVQLTDNKQIGTTRIDFTKLYPDEYVTLEAKLHQFDQSKKEFFEVIQVKNEKSPVQVSPKLSKSTTTTSSTSSNGKSSTARTGRSQAQTEGFVPRDHHTRPKARVN